jgi:hypothetical protein
LVLAALALEVVLVHLAVILCSAPSHLTVVVAVAQVVLMVCPAVPAAGVDTKHLPVQMAVLAIHLAQLHHKEAMVAIAQHSQVAVAVAVLVLLEQMGHQTLLAAMAAQELHQV